MATLEADDVPMRHPLMQPHFAADFLFGEGKLRGLFVDGLACEALSALT